MQNVTLSTNLLQALHENLFETFRFKSALLKLGTAMKTQDAKTDGALYSRSMICASYCTSIRGKKQWVHANGRGSLLTLEDLCKLLHKHSQHEAMNSREAAIVTLSLRRHTIACIRYTEFRTTPERCPSAFGRLSVHCGKMQLAQDIHKIWPPSTWNMRHFPLDGT